MHVSAEHDDVRMNVKHLSVQHEYEITMLTSKVDAQEKQILDLQGQEKKMKDSYNIMLNRITCMEMLIRYINTESGAFKKLTCYRRSGGEEQ